MKSTTSIFSRQFKRTFNHNKYSNLTAPQGQSITHLGWLSRIDLRASRLFITASFVVGGIWLYLDPDWIHETFGHSKQPPKYIIGLYSGLTSQEQALNQQLITRKEKENKLDHFIHPIVAFDAK